MVYTFSKELYPKIALLKAAYTFIDSAYIHLDADERSWIVTIEFKKRTDCSAVTEKVFLDEMLIQSLRHAVYEQTKDIRELLFARSVASSLVINKQEQNLSEAEDDIYSEKEILQDWFTKQ